jgi:hypothetical protein
MDQECKECLLKQDEINKKTNRTIGDIYRRMNSIDKNLNNHVVQLTRDIGTIRTNLEWLDKLRQENLVKPANGGKESRRDIVAQTDVDWIKRFFWISVAAIVGLGAALIELLMSKK